MHKLSPIFELEATFMKHFQKTILLFLSASCVSCTQISYHYPKDRNVANEKGMLIDSLGFYFSKFEPFDSSQTEFVRDSFWQNYLSTNLYALKEPVLYNDYLGKVQYRFLWLRSFHLPMVFTIVNDNEKIILTTKKLDRQPLFEDYLYSPDDPSEDSSYARRGYKIMKQLDSSEGKPEWITVIKADRRANIVYDSTKNLAIADWDHFGTLLKKANFWNIKPYDWAGHTDGAMWIIEAHFPDRYRYIVRQSPSGNIQEIGKFLIDMSGLHEEIY